MELIVDWQADQFPLCGICVIYFEVISRL